MWAGKHSDKNDVRHRKPQPVVDTEWQKLRWDPSICRTWEWFRGSQRPWVRWAVVRDGAENGGINSMFVQGTVGICIHWSRALLKKELKGKINPRAKNSSYLWHLGPLSWNYWVPGLVTLNTWNLEKLPLYAKLPIACLFSHCYLWTGNQELPGI